MIALKQNGKGILMTGFYVGDELFTGKSPKLCERDFIHFIGDPNCHACLHLKE